MKRDNVVEELKEKDILELYNVLNEVFGVNENYVVFENRCIEFIKSKDIHILGYYVNDILVGTLTLNVINLPTGKEATIWDIAVKDEYRRQKIATKLMKKSEEIVKQTDATDTIWFFSGKQRENAHKLYRSLGYNENRSKAFVKCKI